jgi:hypothetical protein
MAKIIMSLALVGSLAAAPAFAGSTDPGVEIGFSTLATVANIVYTPAKIVVAAGGLTLGALAGTFAGGDTRAAYAFWVPSAGGTYFLTPDQMAGRVPIEFFGTDYSDRPGHYGGQYDTGAYDSMYAIMQGPMAGNPARPPAK